MFCEWQGWNGKYRVINGFVGSSEDAQLGSMSLKIIELSNFCKKFHSSPKIYKNFKPALKHPQKNFFLHPI